MRLRDVEVSAQVLLEGQRIVDLGMIPECPLSIGTACSVEEGRDRLTESVLGLAVRIVKDDPVERRVPVVSPEGIRYLLNRDRDG